MPVSLRYEPQISGQVFDTVERIAQDLGSHHRVRTTVHRWRLRPRDYDCYLAQLTVRVVAFALLQGTEIKALAVHCAIRQGAIGQHILSLLVAKKPTGRRRGRGLIHGRLSAWPG
ncbi:hypothetical protein [Reinekea sp.]|uniref:hypothetical protein n=1 Tax=Reinekea sp. TaxID=1970455 RepID=UPI002A837C38|nr:hypothetical protein [Reinekea sp.]